MVFPGFGIVEDRPTELSYSNIKEKSMEAIRNGLWPDHNGTEQVSGSHWGMSTRTLYSISTCTELASIIPCGMWTVSWILGIDWDVTSMWHNVDTANGPGPLARWHTSYKYRCCLMGLKLHTQNTVSIQTAFSIVLWYFLSI